MKKIFKSMLLLIAVTIGVSSMVSCSDDDDSSLTRLFRPIVSDKNIITGLDANDVPYLTLKWDNYTNANQYVITVKSVDGTEEYTQTVDTTTCTFSNLNYDKEYNVAIHSANTTNGLESKDYTFSATTADYPTLLNSLGVSDIIDIQARVSWNAKASYDSLKVYALDNDSLVGKYAVTATDLSKTNKIIGGLKPKTSYRVEAYSGGVYKGKKKFKTVASESFTGNVVDLRDVADEDAYKWFSTSSTTSTYANKIDSLIQAYPNQDITIVLKGNTTYRMPTLALPATTGTIRIITGLTLEGNANFAVSGNFNVNAGASVGGIKLEKITFTDAPLENKGKETSNFGGTYLFNLNGAGSHIGSIDITNCTIKYKRGLCRIQTSAVIDKYNVDNCIIDSIGGYGIANADNAAAQIKNITASNSTFSNCSKLFVGTKGLNPDAIAISNCTFVYCIAEAKSIFDYKGKTIGSFTVKNCLFGKPGEKPNDPSIVTGITGWSGDAAPTCSDCYYTSDLLWLIDELTTLPKAQLPGTTLKGTTDDLFTAPTISNFKIKSDELGTNVPGDPRWY